MPAAVRESSTWVPRVNGNVPVLLAEDPQPRTEVTGGTTASWVALGCSRRSACYGCMLSPGTEWCGE